jgi:hypothetical protein
MRIEGSEVTTLITGVVVLFSALAASSNKFIQRTVKSVTIFAVAKSRAPFTCR